ncbi:MAG: hypothetical protein WBP46_07735 [Thiolinea sp.]
MSDSFDEPLKPKYSNNLPRAKLFLRARLGWLWGYPLPSNTAILNWQTFYFPGPWDQQISVLKTEDLAAAAYSYQRLIHAFPRALPKLVGAVDVWEKRVSLKLQAVRALIEGNSVQPWQALLVAEQGTTRLLRQVEQLKRNQPLLAELLDAFAWWLSLDPKTLEQAVAWIEQEQSQLSAVLENFPEGIKTCALLFILSQDLSTARASGLLALLAHPVWKSQGAFAYKHFIKSHRFYFEHFSAQANGGKLELPVSTEVVPEIHSWQLWLENLLTLPTKERRRVLDLLLKLLTPAVFEQWQAWSKQSQIFLREFEGLAKEYRKLSRQIGALSKSQKSLQKTASQAARATWQDFEKKEGVLIDDLSVWLQGLSQASQNQALLQALSILEAKVQRLPETSLWRQPLMLLKVFTHWQLVEKAASQYDRSDVPRRFKLFLSAWCKYVQAATDAENLERRLEPWRTLNDYYAKQHSRPLHTLECAMLDDANSVGRAVLFFAELAKLCEAAPDKVEDGFGFYYFYLDALSHWPAVAYFQQFELNNLPPGVFEARLVKVFDQLLAEDPSPEQFGRLLQLWRTLDEGISYPQSGHLFRLLAYLKQQADPAIYEYCLQQKAWSLMLPMTEFLPLLKADAQVLPPMPAICSEFSDYPPALRPSLNLLARYHPQAEEVAERILEGIKPRSAKLERELAYLQLKLSTCDDASLRGSLQQRLTNLQLRLQQPTAGKPPSEQRLTRLALKLQHAALHAFFKAWQENSMQVLQAQLNQAFNLESLPEAWLADKEKLVSLLALDHLGPAEKRVVGLLCQAQIQNAYPLVTAPANQTWLHKMKAKGLNLQPWIEGLELSSELELAQASMQIKMRFAKDIFEVFRMGDHFQTCLSRDGVNFFSVVANAADLNKRVLYFFDPEDHVLGRCLLAISDQGQLLSFYIYSHLPADALKPCLHSFVSELMKQTGLQLGSSGDVAKLVASHWYDDGIESLQLESELALFANLRPKLAKLTTATIFNAVQETLAPEPVSELLMLSLMRWDGLKDLFDLKLALALECMRQQILSEYALREIARILLVAETYFRYSTAEKMAAIWPLAQTWLWERVREDILSTGVFERAEMNLLIQHQPWQALRLFRVSKRRIERRTDEYYRQRMDYYHAKTLIAVNRLQAAQKIINALAAEAYNDVDSLADLKAALQERLQAEN